MATQRTGEADVTPDQIQNNRCELAASPASKGLDVDVARIFPWQETPFSLVVLSH